MIGRENMQLVMPQNRTGEGLLARRLLTKAFLGIIVVIGMVIILLVISSHAQAGDYGVAVQHNTPSSGVGNVTPGIDYGYTLDIINTGTNNTGEDINLTVELDAASIAAGWTVTPTGTTIVPGLEMGVANKTTELVTVRAPSDAKFEDTAVVNITVEVIGNESEVGCKDTIQLRSNVVQVYDVLATTTQDTKTGDPGEEVSFSIKVTNKGNGDDTFVFSDVGDELGVWSVSDVDLSPDEFVFVYYNLTIDSQHNTSDILITLNFSSLGDVSGSTYATLDITIHVNPRYEVKLGVNGSNNKEVYGGGSVIFNLTIRNKGTATDSFDIEPIGPTGFWATPSTLTVTLDPDEITVVQILVEPPEGIAIGLYDIIINVTSQNDSSATDEYTFYANVQASYDFMLIPSMPTTVMVDPGDTAVFTGIGIKNEGNDDDIYTFFIMGLPPTWSHSPLPNIPVPAGDTVSFDLDIYTDAASPSGIYSFNLTARSVSDPTKEKTIQLYVELNQVYGVQLPDSVSGKNVSAGDIVSYIIDVKNTGNDPDNFELRLTGDVEPWTWLYYSPTENGTIIHVSPPSGGSLAVYLYVNPPSDYWDLGGDSEIILTIEAESLLDPDPINPASDSVSVTTTVNPIYGVEIQPSQIFVSGDPDETISFLFQVKNTGTVTDSFDISVTSVSTTTGGDTSKWYPGIRFDPTSVDDLAKGAIEAVTMYVDIPFPPDLSLTPPGIYNITIEITSSGDTDVKDTQVFTVDVQQLYWADVQNTVTPKNVDVGETVQFTISIKNKGNDVDMLSVILEGDPDIPGSADWGKLSHLGTGQIDQQSLVDISLGAGVSTDIILKIAIPERTDPTYPTIDPDDVTLVVKVEPSDEDGIEDEVEVTADINPIYEFEFTFLADTKDVLPGDPAEFTLRIENKGTVTETFTYEIFQWEVDWSAYGYTFLPSSIQIAAGSIEGVELSINTPSDLAEAVSRDYNITVKVHSVAGDTDDFENCTIHIEPVYGVELNIPGSTSKAVDVGSTVSYQFNVENIGNAPETFTFEVTDQDISAGGGGDQSSWASLYLLADPSTPVTSVGLAFGESKTMILEIAVPQQSDPNFAVLTAPLEMMVEVGSTDDPTVTDSFLTSTTINPIYSFVISTTAPLNTKDGKPGDIVTFTLQVKNTGTGTDSYGFRISSVDETIFTVASIHDVTGVEVNEIDSTMVSIEITDDKKKALAGTYQIEIAGDSKGEPTVSEVITLNIEIKAAAGVEVSAEVTSDNEEPGESVDYTIKIHNTGNAEDTFRLTLEDEAKDWGDILDINTLTPISEVTLDADSFKEVILRVTIPAQGETLAGEHYSIILKATSTLEDLSDEIKITTTVDEYVELDLEYSGIGLPAKNYDPNDKLPKFSFRVVNNGNKDEDGIQIEIDGIGDDWEYSPHVLPESLGPGKSTTFTLEFTDIPEDESIGTYIMYIYARSSIDDKVRSELVFMTINITKPDLSISSSDVTGLDDISYLKGKIGDTVTITVRIYNVGNAEAKDAQVKLYEEVGGTTTVRDTETISSLAAGSSKHVDFKWEVVADEVDIRIEISGIFESNYDNNKISRIYLDLRPNLRFGGERLNFSKSNPKPGETITITAFIENTGGDAEDVTVNFYEGTRLIGKDILDIDYGDIGEATVDWKVFGDPGDIKGIKAEIELSGAIGHRSDETKTIKISEDGLAFDEEELILWIVGGAIIGMIAALIIYLIAAKWKRKSTDWGEDWESKPPSQPPFTPPPYMPPPPPPPP